MSARQGAPREAWAPAAFAALAVLPFLPAWVRGQLPFWGDLTYIHHPWRAFDAQALAAGRVPLWNPFLYFGMPQAASMQDGLLYPGSLPFFLFGFPFGLAAFHALHFALAGLLTYWWLRSLRLRRPAACAGALVVQLGGVLMCRMIFLNHLAVLSLAPCLLLFFGSLGPLALSLALMFLAGYPTFLIGSAIGAWVLALALRPRGAAWLGERARVWAGAGLLAMGLSAALLLPAQELLRLSRRATGIELSEAISYSFALRDLARWLSPLLEGWSRFSPAIEWWKCCYIGFAGAAAAALGWTRLPRRRAAVLAVAGAAFVVLILGESNPVSRALWRTLPFLRFIRYPGNLSFLAVPALSLLVAAGCESPAAPRWLSLALAVELSAYALWPFPRTPAAVFSAPGPLVEALQAGLSGSRYFLSPLALYEHAGFGVADWKARLYGLTNAPYRIRAASNFGEPLVPRPSYDLMDALHSAGGAAEAARMLPWAGVRFLMAPRPLPVPGLTPLGRRLWEVHRVAGPAALAYHFDAGESVPEGIARVPLPGSARALAEEWPRDDAFSVSGPAYAAGWAFIAEPPFPGWRAWLERDGRAEPVSTLPAAGAFQKLAVPAGPWTLRFRYDPLTWRMGAALSALFLVAFGAYWYNRLLRALHAA